MTPRRQSTPATDEQWWQVEEDVHKAVFAYVRSLEESQAVIWKKNQLNARLYGNCDLAGLTWSTSRRTYDRRPAPTVSENVIQSVIDTVCAKIAKNQPRCTFQTDGADWSTQRRAKQLEKFVEGEFQRTEFYKHARMVFRDACVWGLGVMKITDEDGSICAERILPTDVVVDEIACRTAPPREVHERIFIDREVLKSVVEDEWMTDATEEELAKAFSAIDASNSDDRRYTSGRTIEAHQVALIESFRKPSRPGKKDGRHTICVEGCTLVDETWEDDELPYVFLWFTKPLTGFYGEGLAEKLTGHQIRINKQNRTLEQAHDRFATPRILTHVQEGALQTKLTSEVGQQVFYRGQKPEIWLAPSISPELREERNYLKASAYQIPGVSELAATAKKPGGLDSGESLRAYHDRETERFALQEIDYEEFHLEAGRRYVRLGKKIYARKTDYSTKWRFGNVAKQIKWADVDLDEDIYTMSIEAASLVQKTPAGRLAQVTEWAERGLISTDVAKRLLHHPDLEREVSLMTSALEYVEHWIEHTLDGGEYFPPEPYENLDLGITRRTQELLRIRMLGAPEEILAHFRTWLRQADDLRKQAAAAAQMGAAPAPPQSAFAPQALEAA